MQDRFERHSPAEGKGSLREGAGTLTSKSGVLKGMQYSFRKRFADGIGTNPDESIAASLSGCFSMALSNELGLIGLVAERIRTAATATLEDLARGWMMTRIQLGVRALMPRATQNNFIWPRSRPRPIARLRGCSPPRFR